jgi:hypothetical protein
MVQTGVKGSWTMKFKSDIDIDVADRVQALAILEHTAASIIRDDKNIKHNTGVYFTKIPVDPFAGRASLDYEAAEDLGYVKLDVLNVGIYQQVTSEQHLQKLMQQEPAWDRLYDPEFCAQLIHIGAHYETLIKMPEAVNSIPRLAMFLAVIRPAKRHLIGLSWAKVAKTVWDKPEDGSYAFKKSHAISYSHLVAVNMNLLTQASEQG